MTSCVPKSSLENIGDDRQWGLEAAQRQPQIPIQGTILSSFELTGVYAPWFFQGRVGESEAYKIADVRKQ
ncbi:unnamed protein product [Clonostachys solani]|uniref:Uncharacterized protein n=1 Tax=Clonostachys solani TaxID=160281 RepID=A0A9N9Z1W0_9HYPO|nr:unnamed protein product [Clonostachys solani]